MICSRKSCQREITSGSRQYNLGSKVYCSDACARSALEETLQSTLSAMQKLANDFGDAGVVRRYCDNPKCKRAITLCWKGKRGEYCSNNCLKTEKGETMSKAAVELDEVEQDEEIEDTEDTDETDSDDTEAEEEEETEDEDEDDGPPIRAGKAAPAKKGKAKPAAKSGKTAPAKKGKAEPTKAAPAKKNAGKAPSNGDGRALTFPRNAVIKHTKTWKDCKSLQGSGTAAKRVKAIKDGMTVQQYLDTLKKAGLPPGLGNLIACEKGGYVTVKGK